MNNDILALRGVPLRVPSVYIDVDEGQCPCENCICVAICGSKEYVKLLKQCSLVNKYLIHPRLVIRPINRLQKVKEFLKPTLWDYEININRSTGTKKSWIFDPTKG